MHVGVDLAVCVAEVAHGEDWRPACFEFLQTSCSNRAGSAGGEENYRHDTSADITVATSFIKTNSK